MNLSSRSQLLAGVVAVCAAVLCGGLNGNREAIGEENESQVPPEPQDVPEELEGLGAMFLGRLVSKDLERGEFTLTVDHVPRVWPNSRAERPRAAVGKTFLIDGVSGQFLDRLLLIDPGDTMRVAVRHQRGERFTFPGEGFEKAEPYDPEDYPAPPDEFRGFRGIVTGTIVGKTERTRELTIRIDRIERVLDASRADDAESGIGEKVVVGGFWQQQMRARFERFGVDDVVRVGIDHQVPASDGMRVIEVAERVSRDEPDSERPAQASTGEPQEIPRELRGFSGMILGRLVTKDVERGEFTVTVDYVPRVWRNNRADRPRSAVGKTFRVDGVSGRFLDRLLLIEPGDTMRFEAQQQRDDRLTFPGELLEKAEPYDAEDYPVPPDAFRGFRGMVTGTIVGKKEDSLELTLEIDRIERVLDGNRADDIESGIGESVVVGGFWQAAMRERFENLKVGDTVRTGLDHQVPQSDHMRAIEFAGKVAPVDRDSPEPDADTELDDDGFPVGMHGFRGILIGRLVEKDIEKGTFTFVADEVKRVWRQSKATDLESCQGHTFQVEGVSGRWLDVLITLEKEDRIEVEAFHNGGGHLDFIQEWLKKIE